MDKYTLLILLNLPLVIFGILNTLMAYSKGTIKNLGLMLRLIFWATVFSGLLFAEELYEYLNSHNLTDSTPLSIADVVLVTGLSFCLFLIIRLYNKVEHQEQKLTSLHENVSIELSQKHLNKNTKYKNR